MVSERNKMVGSKYVLSKSVFVGITLPFLTKYVQVIWDRIIVLSIRQECAKEYVGT